MNSRNTLAGACTVDYTKDGRVRTKNTKMSVVESKARRVLTAL